MRTIVWLLIFTLPVIAFASVGEAGFDLLRRDLNAASVGIASASVAFPQTTAFGGNPAALADKTSRIASLSYVDDPLDLKSGVLQYAQPWREYTVGARLQYYDYGTFDRINATGQKLGTFTANDIFIAAAIARRFNDVTIGIEPGFISSKIESYSASALTVSGGIQYTPKFISLLRVGADIRNLGVNTKKYVSQTTKLPTEIRLGLAKKLEHLPLTLLAQGNKWSDTDWYLNAGGEFEIAKSFLLRGGYSTIGKDQKSVGSNESTAGLSAGFGMKYRDYLFDFAYAMQGSVGDRLFLQFSWLPSKR